MTKRKYFFFLTLFSIFGLVWFGLNNTSYMIGGDVMVPVIPSSNIFKMNMWFAGSDSMHYLHFLWYSYYYILEKIGLNVLVSQKLLIFSITTLAFIYTYKLYMELPGIKKKDYLSGLLVATFYIFTPAVFLVVPGYLPLYGVPVCSYYFVKLLKDKNLSNLILFSFFVNLFFFVDLPQPKILISYTFFLFYLISIYYKYSFSGLWQLLSFIFKSLVVFLIVNAYIFLPIIYTVLSGDLASVAGSISSHNGDADLGSAALLYISRFFNTSSYIGYDIAKKFLLGLPFIISFFAAYLMIFSCLHSDRLKRLKSLYLKSLIFLLLILFIAKGSNPPLGSIYKFLVENVPLFSIFRTTANIVILGVFPFSFLVVSAIRCFLPKEENFKHYLLIYLSVLAIYAPTVTGARYYNHHGSPKGKGVIIPQEYFDAVSFLDKLDITNRVLLLPFPDGYVYKKWEYFGPDIISWMSKQNFVYRSGLYGISTKNGDSTAIIDKLDLAEITKSVPYIVFQKDAVDSDKYEKYLLGDLVYSNKIVDIYQNKDSLPHIYSSQSNLSYKKINPTLYLVKESKNFGKKYSVILHENYNKDWRLCYQKKSFIFSYKKCSKPVHGTYNSWVIDQEMICQDSSTACSRESEDLVIKYTIEFWPQRILYLGFFVAILGTLGIIVFGRNKNV